MSVTGNETKATPRPWGSIHETDSYITITGPDGFGIAEVAVYDDQAVGKANAEFIVRACNSHADLLAALKRIANWSISDGSHAFGARLQEVARAAIAAVEGRSSVCPACNQRVPLDGGRLAVHDHPATQERCSFSGEGAAS